MLFKSEAHPILFFFQSRRTFEVDLKRRSVSAFVRTEAKLELASAFRGEEVEARQIVTAPPGHQPPVLQRRERLVHLQVF